MNIRTKKLAFFIFFLGICTNITSNTTFAANENKTDSVGLAPRFIQDLKEDSQNDQLLIPSYAAIGWRYKTENNKLYKRQYNYSERKWIGEWELC